MNKNQYKHLQINGIKYSTSQLSDDSINDLFEYDQGKIIQFIRDWISDSSSITIKTSGSTGTPKEIEMSKESMIKSALTTAAFFGLKESDRVLHCLPVDYIAGKMIIVRAFVAGLNLIAVKPSANPLSSLNEPFKFAAMTPMQIFQSFELPDGIAKLNSIETLIIGGGEISGSLSEKVKLLSNASWQTYGMTETLTHVAVRQLNGKNISEQYNGLPGFEFSTNEKDCLKIKTPYPENKTVQTNDSVHLHSDSSFTFLGRADFTINSGGVKIFPEIIERKLQPFFRQRIVLSSMPDEITGDKLILVVEGKYKPNILPVELSQQAGLSKIETPRHIISLDAFPETATGKINRFKIKALLNSD